MFFFKSFSAYFIFLLANLLSSQSFADQLIIEPDMGEKPIIEAIYNAKHSIFLIMYGFTDKNILDSIIQQKMHGRTVKILLEEFPYKAENENHFTKNQLQSNHIDWRGNLTGVQLIHQKTLLLDNKIAIVMTFNFTRSTFKKERNFALIIDDPSRVKEIMAAFSADWNDQPVALNNPYLIWSPNDSRNKLLNLIYQAKNSINIYAQNITDYKLIGALAKMARKNIKIKILTSNKIRQKAENYLTRAGIEICYTHQYIIHAKVFIIDANKAIIGSTNLTRASLDDNRELSVETLDTNVLKQLKTTFEHDWIC